jgi:hypothetical protein
LKNLGQSKFYFRLVAIFENDGKNRYKYFFNNIKIDRGYKVMLKREFLYKFDRYFTHNGIEVKSIVLRVNLI